MTNNKETYEEYEVIDNFNVGFKKNHETSTLVYNAGTEIGLLEADLAISKASKKFKKSSLKNLEINFTVENCSRRQLTHGIVEKYPNSNTKITPTKDAELSPQERVKIALELQQWKNLRDILQKKKDEKELTAEDQIKIDNLPENIRSFYDINDLQFATEQIKELDKKLTMEALDFKIKMTRSKEIVLRTREKIRRKVNEAAA